MRRLGTSLAVAFFATLLVQSAPSDVVDTMVAHLADVRLKTPDGEDVPVWGTVLDRERLESCLETVDEAEGWPSSWLVVQDRTRDWDLVLRVSRGTDGAPERPDPIFATTRREWNDDEDLEAAYKEAFGEKLPRERNRSLVVQSFSKKIVTTYVYETPDGKGERKGLLALLPPRSLLREAKSVDLGDGSMHTVALVLVEPRFVPSTCADPEEIAVGHTDEGRVLLVLAGSKNLEGQIDVTDRFVGSDGTAPAVPRYACMEGDAAPPESEQPFLDRFRGRPDLPLLILDPRGGSGRGVVIQARTRASDELEETVVLGRIVGSGAGARLLEEVEGLPSRNGEAHPHGHDDATVRHGFEDAERWSEVFDDPARDAWQRPDDVIRVLQVRPGEIVADLGAGTGYFSVRLARAVGPQGKVLALDVEDTLVAWIADRAEKERLPQIRAIRTPVDSPALEPASVDLVLIVNTWHHIDDRIAYARVLAEKLRDGGRVAVVDYREGDLPVGPPPAHKLPPEKVVGEFEAGGLRLAKRDEETLPYQYILVFTPAGSGSPPQ